MAQQEFFPFIPTGSSWENWNGNLVMFYGAQPIPYANEDQWKVVAKNVAQLPFFAAYPVPDPELFEDWGDWALQFTLIINGPSS